MQKKGIRKQTYKKLSTSIKPIVKKLLDQEIDMALKRRAIEVISESDLLSSKRILDAGCGPGYYLGILKKLDLNIEIYGVDGDSEALEKAKKIVKNVYKSDLTKTLPFKSDFFDKVIISEVLEHVSDDGRVLKQIYRVLKPGGRIVITVPNSNYPFFWDPVNWVLDHTTGNHIKNGFWAGIWSNHRRLYSVSSIRKIVEKSGFSIIKSKALTWWCLPFNHNLLYGGKLNALPIGLSKAVRGELRGESILKRLILKLLNLNDKMNDIVRTQDMGVGILLVGEK